MKRIIFAFLLISSAEAIDHGDFVFHSIGAWNQDLEVFQGRAEMAYSLWNDFSIGPVMEFNKFYYAPALGVTWHLEPFELLAHAGPLFWRDKGEKRTSFQISVHANYLLQVTTHWQLLFTAGANLPEKYFRGVPIGAGIRYWF